MSGPKTGRYRLTKEQREIMRERQEYQLQLAGEYEKIREYCGWIAELAAGLDGLAAREVETVYFLHPEDGAEDAAEDMAEERMAAMKARVGKALAKYAGKVSERDLAKLREMSAAAQGFYEELAVFYREMEARGAELAASLAVGTANAIREGMKLDFDLPGQECRYRIEDLLQEAQQMKLSSGLREQEGRIREKMAANVGEEFLETYYLVTVLPFIKECRVWVQEEAQYRREWQELLRRHAVLVREVGEAAEVPVTQGFMRETGEVPVTSGFMDETGEVSEVPEFKGRTVDMPVMPEWSREAMKGLEAENRRLEQKLMREEEQAYISRTVDEVMKEMGYLLIGRREAVKRSGRKFHHELFSFDDDTAVSVTTGEDGQITMELGKLDTVDRIPTAGESRQLRYQMEDFCDEFGEIRQKLADCGIVAEQLSMLPAEEQFAQVFNTGEYRMEEAGMTPPSRVQPDQGRREKRPARKVMREVT